MPNHIVTRRIAKKMLKKYQRRLASMTAFEGPDNLTEDIAGFITDLLHVANDAGEDPRVILDAAEKLYAEES